MWLYNRIVLLAIILLLTITASGYAIDTCSCAKKDISFKGGKTAFRHNDKDDWFPAIIEFKGKTVRVSENKTGVVIAQFDGGTVQVGMHKRPSKRKWSLKIGIPLGALLGLSIADTKWNNDITKSHYFKGAVAVGLAAVPALLFTTQHIHFVLSKDDYKLHVRVAKGEEKCFQHNIRCVMQQIPRFQTTSQAQKSHRLSFGISPRRGRVSAIAALRF